MLNPYSTGLLSKHTFVNTMFEYGSFHYRDGDSLLLLYNVSSRMQAY